MNIIKHTFLILFVASILIACGGKEVDLTDAKKTVVNQKEIPEQFKGSISKIIKQYSVLKDALVEGDEEAARKATGPLMTSLRDINILELSNEDMMKWSSEAEMMQFSLEEIANAPTIDEKRINFSDLSESMYAVIQDFGAKEGTVYIQYCPMAFNNNGASWISTEANILNPYFGDIMLECGVVNEVITFEK